MKSSLIIPENKLPRSVSLVYGSEFENSDLYMFIYYLLDFHNHVSLLASLSKISLQVNIPRARFGAVGFTCKGAHSQEKF